MMLKEAQYPNWGWPIAGVEYGKVAYAIIGGCCYFSGLTASGQATSTINAAESIVQAIADQEGVPIEKLRFFDLQTHRGYDKPEGEFAFDELVFDDESLGQGKVSVSGWAERECPNGVIELFSDCIGKPDQPVKIWTPAEAKSAGYSPGTMASPNTGDCFSYIRAVNERNKIARKLMRRSPRLGAKAEQLLGHFRDTHIVVDHQNNPELLALSRNHRYCVWQRDPLGDN